MNDPVKLALLVVEKDREIENLREQLQTLTAKFTALNSRHQQARAKLASAERESADVQRLNRALCARMNEGQQANLIAEQAMRIEQLRDENASLRQQLDEAQRVGSRQAHRFRRREYMDNPKRPGRQRGKGKFSHRRRPSPERVTRHESQPLPQCPICGCADLRDRRKHQNWQIDLPEVMTEITRFVTESAVCPHCEQRVQSKHPEQLSLAAGAAAVCFGPRLVATAADLHSRLGVPYAKIADFLGMMLGERITAGALCQNVLRLAKLAEPIYNELVQELRRAGVVHADETGWRIGTLNAWLWVFTNQQITVYLIRSGEGARGHEAIIEILGKQFPGVLVSDCFSAYDKDKLDEWLKQKCFAHLLKDLAAMQESAKAAAAAFLTETKACLKLAIELKSRKEHIPDGQYSRHCREVEEKLDNILRNYAAIGDEDAARFVARLAKQRQHLFTFLYHDDVPPTNNQAERMLRPGVISRKTQGCNKSQTGADAHAILGSILATEKQNGRSPVRRLTRIICRRAPPPCEYPQMTAANAAPAAVPHHQDM